MLVYQSALVLSVLRVARCRAGVSLLPTPSPSWILVAGKVLREALTGPLTGQDVMLIVDDGVQLSISFDLLMSGLTSPTVIFHTTAHNTDNDFMTRHLNFAQGASVVLLFIQNIKYALYIEYIDN